MPASRAERRKFRQTVRMIAFLPLNLATIRRARGSGWLVCQHCGEHALQEVVDVMTFVRLFFYRLGVVRRERQLVCQRCGNRRRASRTEREALRTPNGSIHRAFLAPIGFIALVALAAAGTALFAGIGRTAAAPSQEWVTANGSPIGAPLSFAAPVGWNNTVVNSSSTGARAISISQETASGFLGYTVVREPSINSLATLLTVHVSDQFSIQTEGYPTVPPAASCITVAGVPAAVASFNFQNATQPSRIEMVAFVHQNVGYVVTFEANQQAEIAMLPALSQHVLTSIRFAGSDTASSAPAATASSSYTVSCVTGSSSPIERAT